jgi:hypothetical protein
MEKITHGVTTMFSKSSIWDTGHCQASSFKLKIKVLRNLVSIVCWSTAMIPRKGTFGLYLERQKE